MVQEHHRSVIGVKCILNMYAYNIAFNRTMKLLLGLVTPVSDAALILLLKTQPEWLWAKLGPPVIHM